MALTRPYWPGLSTLPGFANAATSRMVPVPRSTSRSAATNCPECANRRPSLNVSERPARASHGCSRTEWGVLIDFAIAMYSGSLTEKYALIGDTCDTVVSKVAGPTRSPICAVGLDFGVELTLRDRLLLSERAVAFDIASALGQLRLRLRDLRTRLGKCSVEWSRIDLEQDVAFADQCALAVGALQQIAADLRTDLRVDVSVERRDPLTGNGHVPFEDCRVLDFERRCRQRRRLRARAACGEGTHRDRSGDAQDESPHHPHLDLLRCRHTRTTQLQVQRQSPDSKARSRLVQWRDLANGEMLDNKCRSREMRPTARHCLRFQ